MIYDLLVEESARPSDWVVLRVKDLARVVGGGTPDTAVADYWNPAEIPWVTPTDITSCENPVLSKTERCISKLGLNNSSATLLPLGTTLLTSRATIGECRIAGTEVTTNQGFASLVPYHESDAAFLFVLAQTMKPVLVRLACGTTFIEVSRRNIRKIKVCVPSSAEERSQIAGILTAGDKAIEAARARLIAARRLKTSLMQQLFNRGIPGRHSSFQQVTVFRYEFEVPKSWDTDRLRSSVEIVDYGTNEPGNEERRGLPVLAIPQVIKSRFRLGDCSYAEVTENEAEALRLSPDDVLLIRTNGNSEYIGKSTVVGSETDRLHIIFASYLIRIRTQKDKLQGRYLNYFLASPLGRRQCLAMANTSAGNYNLGARSIKRICLPRPELEEQEEIVGLVDAAEDSIENAEREIQALERVRQSLLQNLLTGKVRLRVEP